MKITGFNPRTTITMVQEPIQSGAEECKITARAFEAIGYYQKINRNLDSLNSDITQYVNPRNQEITDFIQAFNQLGDKRNNLLKTNLNYKTFKQSVKKAEQLAYQLSGYFN